MSSALQPHGLQHTRLPSTSLTPRVCSNSCPFSQRYHPTISSSVTLFPLIFPRIRVFSNESALHIRWPKYWSFSFSNLISFRIDCFDLLAVQGTLKSLLQHHSSKASVLWCSASIMVQLSHLPMTTGKTIALTRRTFVSEMISLLFNRLSRLVIVFLPRSKRLWFLMLKCIIILLIKWVTFLHEYIPLYIL